MKRSLIIALIILGVYFVSCTAIISSTLSDPSFTGNVAVIPIEGTITLGAIPGGFDYGFVRETLKSAEEDPSVEAIVLNINSPGGAAVASDEIGRLVRESKKPTVAWIREVGASGAYWIATNTDHIIANRMSITGSIGVVGSYLDFSEFLERYNVSYERLVSGPYKDSGSPFKALSEDERSLLQQKIDTIHGYFVEEVSNNRGLTQEQVATLATGEIFLGIEAYNNGLIDEIGGEQEVIAYLEEVLGKSVELYYYERSPTVREILGLNAGKSVLPNLPEGIQLR